MTMVHQILLMWALSVMVPIVTMAWVTHKIRRHDGKVISLLESVQQQLEECRNNERELTRRVSELESKLGITNA